MAVLEDLENLRKQIDPETLDKVGSILEGVKNEVKHLVDSNAALSGENKRRRLEADDWKSKYTDVEIERDKFKEKVESFDTSQYQVKIKDLETKVTMYTDMQRKDIANYIEKYHADPKFEKAKTMFVLPEQDAEKKFQWDKLESNAVEKNVAAKNQLESLDYFGQSQKPNVFKEKGGIELDGKVVPTLEEAQKLKREQGIDSTAYKEALKLRMQAKDRGLKV